MLGNFLCRSCKIDHPRTGQFFIFNRRKTIIKCRIFKQSRILKPELELARKKDAKRRKLDPLYKLKKTLRTRLVRALKSKNWIKTNQTLNVVGCGLSELKQHLEEQFQPGMTWSNHGTWHIDHIIPLSTARTDQEMYKLCHFTNLQPLWAIENLQKGSKIDINYA